MSGKKSKLMMPFVRGALSTLAGAVLNTCDHPLRSFRLSCSHTATKSENLPSIDRERSDFWIHGAQRQGILSIG